MARDAGFYWVRIGPPDQPLSWWIGVAQWHREGNGWSVPGMENWWNDELDHVAVFGGPLSVPAQAFAALEQQSDVRLARLHEEAEKAAGRQNDLLGVTS